MPSARKYSNDVIVRTFTKWDANEIVKEFSQELSAEITAEEIRDLFRRLSGRLGPMRSYKGVTDLKVTSHLGQTPTAWVEALAEFEIASATIEIELMSARNAWKVTYFGVESLALQP